MTHQPFFIPAVIFAVLALPLIAGVVPPNRIYGVRTRATLAKPDLWYRANRAAGVGVLVASAVYLEVARIRPYSPSASDDFGTFLVHVAAFALPLVVALIVAARSAPPSG